MDGVDRHTESPGLCPVDIDTIVWHILLAVGTDLREDGAAGGQTEELIAGFHELGVADTTAVEQLQFKALAAA